MTMYLEFENKVRLDLPDKAALSMDSEEFRALVVAVKEYSVLLDDKKVIIHTPTGDMVSDTDHEIINK